jgi:uncharacterized protein (TIGR03435 family)
MMPSIAGISAGISLLTLLSGAVSGQSVTAGAPPTFEIADVHVSPRAMTMRMSGGVLRAGRYEIRKATMLDLIRTAYGVDPDRVLGGPAWLDTDHFDVTAKAPATATPDSAKLMLQALLAERFKLVVHTDTKPMPAFILSMGKGKPKLKEPDGSGEPGCRILPQPGPPDPNVIPYNNVSCRNASMDVFVPMIHAFANGYLTNPLVDQTGLKGNWDFDLHWTSIGLLTRAGADGITLFDAVDKQLGLHLEAGKSPMPVVVVESVSQKPTDNPPGVTTALPPLPPAEFEVADIKLTPPDFKGIRLQLLPSGRMNFSGATLKFLIEQAWSLTDEMVAGVPKWGDTDRFDIIAKVDTGTGPTPQFDIDALWAMVRALMADRFKLTTHTEDRPVSGYVLSAPGKPKLTKADTLNRTGCKEGPGADGKDPRIANPVLSRLLNCQNMTMAQFADLLPSLAGGYVHTPVLDSTGLTDAYDFTLSFSAIGILQNNIVPGQPAPAAGAPAASDPNGAVSLPDAVSKQMGLKLEMQKRPMPVLVVDRAEKPSEN